MKNVVNDVKEVVGGFMRINGFIARETILQ